jgi:hypothetical protein
MPGAVDRAIRLSASEEAEHLENDARVPMSFEVRRVLDAAIVDDGFGGLSFSERNDPIPYLNSWQPPIQTGMRSATATCR